MSNGFKILGISIITLAVLEIGLRLSGLLNSYTENVGQPYASSYNIKNSTWFPFWEPNTEYDVDHGDFKHYYVINGYGFRGGQPVLDKPDSITRIIVLGDSFAEGMGAPSDSAWPRQLETLLLNRDLGVEVINAGISGSDPFFEFLLFEHKLLKLKPDYVMLAVNSTDLDDVIFRGEVERFHEDGTTHYRKGPWYEPIYKYSFVVRLYCRLVLNQPLVGIFLSEKQYQEEMELATNALSKLIYRKVSWLNNQGIEVFIILHPVPLAAANPNADVSYHPKPFMRKLNDSLLANHIPVINLDDEFESLFAEQPVSDFAHMNDGHYNSKGYAFFASSVLAEIDKQHLLVD
jgi:lysophospholipase L1-like esterase